MFGRRESLREFIRNLHEESTERYEGLLEETREFNREILRRNEKVYTSAIAELETMGEEHRRSTEQIQENTERTRAGTQAILRLLDRFDDQGGAAA